MCIRDRSIDLELEQGHNYAIIGKSGSGKSTLMNMIGLLDLPTEGKIFFKGSDISHYNAGQQAKYRNKMCIRDRICSLMTAYGVAW